MPATHPPSSTAVAADGWIAGLLLAALLALAGTDVAARVGETRRRAQPGAAWPAGLSLVAPPVGQWLGGTEVFQGNGSLVEIEGLGPLESDGQRFFRHAFRPASAVIVRSEHLRARLRLRFYNDVAGQELRVTWNDAPLETLAALPLGNLTREYALAVRPHVLNRFAVAFAGGAEENEPPPAPPIPAPPAGAVPGASPAPPPLPHWTGTFFTLDLDFFDAPPSR